MEIRTILDIFLSSQSSLILRYSTSEYFSIINTPIVLLVFYLFVYNGEITTYMIQYAPSFFTSVNGNEIELLEVTKIFFSHSSISHCSKTMLWEFRYMCFLYTYFFFVLPLWKDKQLWHYPLMALGNSYMYKKLILFGRYVQKNCKLKEIIYDIIYFYFELSGTCPIVKNNYLQHLLYNIQYLLDNYKSSKVK